MRTSNLNNYVNLLNDVYANGSISTSLCRKHKISNNTTRTLKELRYADKKGNSLMTKRPTMNDVNKVISRNRDISKGYNTPINQTEIKFVKPKVDIKAVPTKVENTKTTEINLFWGMIKIKR